MSELVDWFKGLNEAVTGGEAPAQGIGPSDEEAKVLLAIGKTVAERGPQRYYAMLAAFAIGRALGRAETERPDVDGVEFLRWAQQKVDQLPGQAGDIQPPEVD